jgi:hypothetical protein
MGFHFFQGQFDTTRNRDLRIPALWIRKLGDLQAVSTRSEKNCNKEGCFVRGVCAHYFIGWERD